MYKSSDNLGEKGISLVELLVVLAVVLIVAAVIINSFSNQTQERSLQGERLAVLTILDQARSLAMSSVENDDFGVYFATTTKTLFEGSVYNASDPDNEIENVAAGTQLIDISLNGGGSSVVFDRLTGRTSQYGTITIQSISDSSASSTITIYQTGIIETQE